MEVWGSRKKAITIDACERNLMMEILILTLQIIAGIVIVIAPASPLMICYIVSGDVMPTLLILTVAVFIVSLAVCRGLFERRKKII